VLYMTGHSGTFIRADMLNQDVSLIRKPFTPGELGRKIRKMLPGKLGESSRESACPKENAAAHRESGA
jgi:hypothetical protein